MYVHVRRNASVARHTAFIRHELRRGHQKDEISGTYGRFSELPCIRTVRGPISTRYAAIVPVPAASEKNNTRVK